MFVTSMPTASMTSPQSPLELTVETCRKLWPLQHGGAAVGQLAGAGASFFLNRPATFFTAVPPKSAQRFSVPVLSSTPRFRPIGAASEPVALVMILMTAGFRMTIFTAPPAGAAVFLYL